MSDITLSRSAQPANVPKRHKSWHQASVWHLPGRGPYRVTLHELWAAKPVIENSVLHFIGALNSLKGFFPSRKNVISYRIKDEDYQEEKVVIKNWFENLKDNDADIPDNVKEMIDKCIDLFNKLAL